MDDFILNLSSKFPYLIKFNDKEDYAKKLINLGQLHVSSLQKYISMEQGRGDFREAGLFDCAIRIGLNKPVYCMYAVSECDICDGLIKINRRVVKEFCDEGYITLIDTKAFITQLYDKYLDVECGLVVYKNRSFEDDKELFLRCGDVMFYKDSSFSYQSEFRVVFQTELAKIIHRDELLEVEIMDGYEEMDIFIGDISSFAKIYNVKDCEMFDDFLYVSIN